MEENIRTSDEDVVEGESPTDEIESEEKEVELTTEEETWRDRYAQSTREAQRILDDQKALVAEKERLAEENARLQREYQEYLEQVKGENPEAAQIVEMRRGLTEMQKALLEEKEERQLSSYLSDNPLAASHKEALRKLGRVSPKASYAEIWNENFKSAYEAGIKDQEAKRREGRSKQAESGRGSISKDPTFDSSDEEISKLPLEKRKEYFKKMGL